MLEDVFAPVLVALITGPVEQMKAKNKWGLYLVGAGYVTVSSCFILEGRVHPLSQIQSSQKQQRLLLVHGVEL